EASARQPPWPLRAQGLAPIGSYRAGGSGNPSKEEYVYSVRVSAVAAVVAAGVVASAPSASADEVADFYKGKQITIIVGTAAGGNYGLITQMAQRHVMKYIPGQPTLIAKYMPGGGGHKAHNYLYNVAPRDG